MTQQKPTGTPSPRRIVDRREWQSALKSGDHGLKPGWAHAAVTLLMWMDQDGACWPGQESLAAAMGKSSRAVRDDLAWLEHVGWVNVRQGGRRGDRHESSRYQSTLPTGTVVPTGAGIQTDGFSAGYPSPNRNPGTPHPEPTDAPTGTQVPGNSQKNSQGNTQKTPADDAGSQSLGPQASASRQAAAIADGRTEDQITAEGLQAARAALRQAAGGGGSP